MLSSSVFNISNSIYQVFLCNKDFLHTKEHSVSDGISIDEINKCLNIVFGKNASKNLTVCLCFMAYQPL